jgi:hypothetical protein
MNENFSEDILTPKPCVASWDAQFFLTISARILLSYSQENVEKKLLMQNRGSRGCSPWDASPSGGARGSHSLCDILTDESENLQEKRKNEFLSGRVEFTRYNYSGIFSPKI